MPARRSTLARLLLLAVISSGGNAGAGTPYSHYEAEVDRLVEIGDGHVEDGHHAQAIKWYLDAFELMPLPDLLHEVAGCYLAIGQRTQAEHYYRMYLDMLHGMDDEQDTDALVEEFLCGAPAEIEDDSEFEAELLAELDPVREKPVAIDLVVTAFLSDPSWGPGYTLAFGAGLSVLALDPVLLRASLSYANEFLGTEPARKGGNTLVGDVLVAILMPRLLAGRIAFMAGALTQVRRTWTRGGDQISVLSVGPSLASRFHIGKTGWFFLEVGAAPLFHFGTTGRWIGFEVVVRGGLSFGL
jgi:hypothetical protein